MPVELADELFDKLTAYYADDENVTVIVDRRKSDRRERGGLPDDGAVTTLRALRDRRQRAAVDRLPQPRIDGNV